MSRNSPPLKNSSLLSIGSGSSDDEDSDSSDDNRATAKEDPKLEEFINRRKGESNVAVPVRKRKSRKTLLAGSTMSIHSGTKKADVTADDYDIHESRMSMSKSKLSIAPQVNSSTGRRSSIALNVSLLELNRDQSWELWWVQSPLWRRKLVFLLVICAILAIIQLAMGIVMVLSNQKQKDPYLCSSQKCRALADWMSHSNANSSSPHTPCSHFYQFSCQNHKENDAGGLFKYWYKNFARLESDGENGESILAKILARPSDSDVIGQRIIKFYQVCMRIWQLDSLMLEDSLKHLVRHVFKDFDLWGQGEEYELEKGAVQMIKIFGDFGFFKTLAPVDWPRVLIRNWVFTSHIKKENVFQFLPIIYDALGIINQKHRHRISYHLFKMGATVESLLNHGFQDRSDILNCTTSNENKIPFDFRISYYLAYYEDDVSGNFDRELEIKMDPLEGEKKIRNFKLFQDRFNCWMQKTFVDSSARYGRATLATFWSLRLLVELVHDADDMTAIKYGLIDTGNNFFEVFQQSYYGRQKESRCYQSLTDSMGYYPIFRFFGANNNARFRHHEAMGVIKHAASALLEQFRPAEEGGLAYVSSRFRERVYRVLHKTNDINILIPILEDDPTFTESYMHLDVGDSHVHNIIAWREFTFRRTRHFWTSKSPQGKLVWYKDFYSLDRTDPYESPSVTKITLIKIPPAIFVYPFWNNDIEVANYAGCRVMAAKTLLQLLQYDYAESNTNVEIKVKKSNGIRYREGVTTDADHEPCEVLTYNWAQRIGEPYKKHQVTIFNPHFLAFRYGRRFYEPEKEFGVFPTSLALKTMLHKFLDEIGTLRNAPFWDFPQFIRQRLMHQKLIRYEKFSEAQLFFLISFRELCRSRVSDELLDIYHYHATENIAGLMQMEEFASTWRCSPNSMMNPALKCFSR